jgi:hypothetical protein
MATTLLTAVFSTFDFVGFHQWLSAPDEVDYLRHRHRHLFKVRVEIAVEHTDRAIEFHMLKRNLLEHVLSGRKVNVFDELELDSASCEDVALQILQAVVEWHPGRPYYRVEVSEDGENGAIVEAKA